MISDADIATLAELGVVASMQPAFDAAWGSPASCTSNASVRAVPTL